MTELTRDEHWLLSEAARPGGFMPNIEAVANFATSLERRGWLGRNEHGPTWHITPEGRAVLEAAE